ncbi:MAG TPA: hypothetical protein P5222_08705 [Candidatus Cloacimonadota bacterium]|nr:hypothetical protein [Candidatus Cloacimonadota bacterium]HOR58604.1 hypothetical protein [Candidatus Cloacimonadota bacterium]HRS50763.1 hypothetical protein [Candidatus Cloacimonadota bacterium]
MSNSRITIRLELTGKEKLDEVIAKLAKEYKLHAEADFSDIESSLNEQISALDNFKVRAKEFGLVMNGVSSAIGMVLKVYEATVGKFVSTAAEFEQLELRLQSLYQDTDKAAAAFEKFREVAADTPATLKGVVEAGATLKAFGLEAEETISAAADLAAYMGMDVVEAAAAMGRAFAGGVGAADILRERGVLNLIKSFKGIDDLTKLTLPEFREAMLSTFTDSAAGIAGSADRMSESYTGAVANMEDAVESLQAAIGSKLTPILGAAANAVAKFANLLSGTKTGIEAVKKSLMDQRVEFEKLTRAYQYLHLTQNRSKEQNEKYQRVIKELMEKYPNYLKNIDLEKSAWGDIAAALNTARDKLQEWINMKIKQAIVEDRSEDLAKEYKKLAKAEDELATLQAEFAAGTKDRVKTIQTVPNPLGAKVGGYNPGSTVVPSKWANRAYDLEIKIIPKLKGKIQNINKEILDLSARIDNDILAPADETKSGSSGGGLVSGSSSAKSSQEPEWKKRLEEYQAWKKAAFDEQKKREQELDEMFDKEIQKAQGSNKEELQEAKDWELGKIREEYREKEAAAEKQYYEELKFYDSNYYEWKLAYLEAESRKLFASDEAAREKWLAAQTETLNAEKKAFDNSYLERFESEYEDEMSHLAELRELGLATYDEIAAASWKYYNNLKAIFEGDGELTEAEKELLNIYLKRAQAAQLAVNRDSDKAKYYNEVKFLDSSYYEWKKARIEEDVRLMKISEEQKAIILKASLAALDQEMENFKPGKSIFGRLLDAFDIPEEQQTKIKSTFQTLSNQISSIWSQMYNNIASAKDHALKEVEERAKKERKTDVWLAKEKEKIEEEYAKKQKQMKKIEQRMQISSALANTAEGVTNALTVKPAWLSIATAAAVGALGLAQVKVIAEQKFSGGGQFRGKGTTTSDSNIIAVSDQEYIVSAERVARFGVPFFDALNFGSGEQIRKALAGIKIPNAATVYPQKAQGYASGGVVSPQAPVAAQNVSMNVVLKCDGKALAKAVIKGKKKIIST